MSVIYDFKENIKDDELENISNCLKSGGLVIFPTETVYGIGASAIDDIAVKRIFEAKGRPQDNPLIVHISNYEMLESVAWVTNDIEKKLMQNFWPGPLTIILKSKENLPASVTAGLDTIGVRMPANNIALEIISNTNLPIAAPSANVSGRPSGTNIYDIYNELKDKVDIFVDGGNTNIGIESTVLKVEGDTVKILRPGKISKEDIEALNIKVELDEHIFKDVAENEKVMSPGMKHKHYAPKTKSILIEFDSDEKMIEKIKKYKLKNEKYNICSICFNEHEQALKDISIDTFCIGQKEDLMQISKNIFSTLRTIDKYNYDVCLIEGVPKEKIGTAILNRMIRACGYEVI